MDNTPQSIKMTQVFFFTTLGMVVSLFVFVIAFINLLFSTYDVAIPDTLRAVFEYGYNTYSYDGIRTALATVIISFPLFFVLTQKWYRMIKTSSQSAHDELLKRWVTNGILFFVVVTAAVDMIVLVRYFVSGEITARFVLKVLSVITVMSLVGLFYISTKRVVKNWVSYFLFGVSVVLVSLAIVYSFMIIGLPREQRELQMDERRITDLQNIQSQVVSYWQQYGELPESMSTLVDPLSSWQQIPVDPEFDKGFYYTYTKTNTMEFDICATFRRDIPVGWNEQGGGSYPVYRDSIGMSTDEISVSSYPGMGIEGDTWSHAEGYTCFHRTIDPQRYPVYSDDVPKPL